MSTQPPANTWTRRLEQAPFWPMLGLGTLAGLGLGWWLLFRLSAGSASFPVAGVVVVLLSGWLLAARLRAVARKAGEQATDELDDKDSPIKVKTPRKAPASKPLLDMRPIAGEEFLMGSKSGDSGSYSDERPQHRVRLDPFLLARTPVTRRQYTQVMKQQAPDEWRENNDDQLPANHISWDMAVHFCNALSNKEGLPPAYDDEQRLITASDGYRLPTEAEWEYACRAGTRTPWFWGDDAGKTGEYAWFNKNSGNKPHPVGLKKANPWGLHDLSGNVWEWCQDWYADYKPGLQVSPTGPKSGTMRVLRGGSAWSEPRNLRSAYRDRFQPGNRSRVLGFRCARARRQS